MLVPPCTTAVYYGLVAWVCCCTAVPLPVALPACCPHTACGSIRSRAGLITLNLPAAPTLAAAPLPAAALPLPPPTSARLPQDLTHLRSLIQRHVKYTNSTVGRAILLDWEAASRNFVKVRGPQG